MRGMRQAEGQPIIRSSARGDVVVVVYRRFYHPKAVAQTQQPRKCLRPPVLPSPHNSSASNHLQTMSESSKADIPYFGPSLTG